MIICYTVPDIWCTVPEVWCMTDRRTDRQKDGWKKWHMSAPKLPWICKNGRNDSKFTIGKYHINTMDIIKLFRVNIFMPVGMFPCLTIWLFCIKKPFWTFGQFRRPFKETNGKNRDFALRKKGREKTQMAEVINCCHQVTWAQKTMTKKREWIFYFKIFKYE